MNDEPLLASDETQLTSEAEESLERDPELDTLPGVEIEIEVLPARQRRISARILIPAPADPIWQVLTQYESLPDFLPNLVESTIIGEEDGCKLVKQVGKQTFLFVKFSATVVLKLNEDYPKQIAFSMTQGDFQAFFGTWELVVQDACETQLIYQLTLQAPRHMPLKLIEQRLKRDMSVNLVAIRDHVLSLTPG